MILRRAKCLLVAAFSLFSLTYSTASFAQTGQEDNELTSPAPQSKTLEHREGKKEKPIFDANEVIFGHVLDAHEFHFFSWKGSDGEEHHATIPLPVILYSPQKGLSAFMSSAFHHGEHIHNGYQLVTEHYKEHLEEQGVPEGVIKSMSNEKIVAVDAAGLPDLSVKVYDFSLSRNVVQMIIALALLVWIMTSAAKGYRTGQGVTTAPKGLQNLVEPVVTFIRDEVARPNIGHKYGRYMPLLLTVFFFILINNLFGLIPGSANVTGNIAFTLTLGVISFLYIIFSGNKHYWGHIFNPPVPLGIKFIMVPVEILSIFTKPFALIIRLFANMLAGHIIIICLISLIFIFGSMGSGIGYGFSPVSVGFSAFIYVIEILVAFIQAFIFANLTAVFIGQAVEETHHEAVEHAGAPTEPVIV